MPHYTKYQMAAPDVRRGQERIFFFGKNIVIRWFAVALVTGVLLVIPGMQSTARAQSTPIIVTVAVLPPYSPDLSVWEENPGRVLITLQNTDALRSYTIRLSGILQDDAGTVTIRTKDNYPVTPITIGPNATL
ncbi:MAG TPA: hypothetical protein VFA55_00520, partial [Candidatus Kapabacteria bacterium]|nr:hypothetical protein [Candidatus Kapabacteria bacterium]